MTLNMLKDFLLILFVIASFLLIIRERNSKFGVTVKEGDKVLASGKQGVTTTIGRAASCDVRIKEKTVSRLQAAVSYNPKTDGFDLVDYGKHKGNCASGYFVANHQLKFTLFYDESCYMYGFVVEWITLTFMALQLISSLNERHDILAAVPYIILIAYSIASYFMRADRQPITESIFAILLTFYIDSVMYPAMNDFSKYDQCAKSAIMSVCIYITFNILMRLVMLIDIDKHKLHGFFRVAASVAILALIILNIALAKNINGAYNWISIGPITFQPSEIVKLLLAFVLITPLGDKFYSVKNLILELGIPVICCVYALLIRDVGVLLQFGVLFVTAILIQNINVIYSLLMLVAGVFGCELTLKLSSTAAYRFNSWLGTDYTLFESLTAAGIFDKPDSYGYQSFHSLIAAFKSGGLLGNDGKFNIMNNITASNSDLVMSIIGQKNGSIIIYIILSLYLVLIFNIILNLRQQNQFQQMYSILAISLITFAMALNTCGTFGIIALTGIVNPCLSDGMSSAICYGALFGVLATTSINKKYFNKVKGR